MMSAMENRKRDKMYDTPLLGFLDEVKNQSFWVIIHEDSLFK